MAGDDIKTEVFRNLTTTALSALRFSTWCNGGALIALITLLGDGAKLQMRSLSIAACWFIAGVSLGGFAHITAYLVNLSHHFELNNTRLPFHHTLWWQVSLLLVVLSILAFVAGSVTIALAISAPE